MIVVPSGWRRKVARSEHPVARALRALARAPDEISLPIPKAVAVPAVWTFLVGRRIARTARRVLLAEPFFYAHVASRGRRLRTGIFLHWIQGAGEIIVGDDVLFDGKSSITFANRFVESPRLVVGSRTEISNRCDITVGKQVTIGSDCKIASGVLITDSSGHPSEPLSRLDGAPPADEDVRPVTIGDNVWIGKRAIILPGVTIGEGSMVSAGAVVTSDIPPYTLAAGNPARKVAAVPRREARIIP